jgi:hypothetical protein
MQMFGGHTGNPGRDPGNVGNLSHLLLTRKEPMNAGRAQVANAQPWLDAGETRRLGRFWRDCCGR